MVLARLDDKDISCDHRVYLSVQFHHSFALEDDKNFVIIWMNVYVRAIGSVICMGANIRGFIRKGASAEVFAGYEAVQKMSFAHIGKLFKS